MAEMFNLVVATLKFIQDRRSIREYTADPVSDHDLDLILEAARQAPSGENAQPWRFIVVKDTDTRKKLGAIAGGGSGRRFTAEYVTKKMQERFSSLEDEAKKTKKRRQNVCSIKPTTVDLTKRNCSSRLKKCSVVSATCVARSVKIQQNVEKELTLNRVHKVQGKK